MRKTLTVAIAALAIGLAGCTSNTDNKDTQKYTSEAKENFVDECAASALKARPGDQKQARDTCQCVVDKLEQGGLPYNREANDEPSFKGADQAIKDGKPLPENVRDDFDRATADCRR